MANSQFKLRFLLSLNNLSQKYQKQNIDIMIRKLIKPGMRHHLLQLAEEITFPVKLIKNDNMRL